MNSREKRRMAAREQARASAEAMCQSLLGKSREESGAKFSNGCMPGFREGWAIIPFSRKPHYWKRKDLTHEYSALCGYKIDQTNYQPGAQVQFDPGDFMDERCKRCAVRL